MLDVETRLYGGNRLDSRSSLGLLPVRGRENSAGCRLEPVVKPARQVACPSKLDGRLVRRVANPTGRVGTFNRQVGTKARQVVKLVRQVAKSLGLVRKPAGQVGKRNGQVGKFTRIATNRSKIGTGRSVVATRHGHFSTNVLPFPAY
jgi:hypothetical protein